MHKHYLKTGIIIGVMFGGLLYIGYSLSNNGSDIPVNENGKNKNVGTSTYPITKDVSNLIKVTSPKSEEIITATSSLTITGEARGNWYFEASFPVIIVNWDGLIIGEGYAQAQGEWMTTDFVPFISTINFERPEINDNNREYARRGWIILKKDNPSGLLEHDAALEIPIYFE